MNEHANDVEMKLPRTLDLAAAEGLLETLQSRLQENASLRVDASAVQVLTLPCVQIILSALRTYEQMSIVHPSEEYLNAFQDLGIDCRERLADEMAVAATADAGIGADTAVDCEAPAEAAQTEAEPMSKRVLTIDDSKTIRDMLMLTLAEAGFDVLQAVDGQDGLDVLDREQVDVVITDINMPRMDGYEVIRNLRNNSAHRSIPILVLTTESEADKKSLARAAGATGWMVKPFDPERLIATINKVAP
jgi:two-component system, chemotaxis family, chemotaxis protein CheY